MTLDQATNKEIAEGAKTVTLTIDDVEVTVPEGTLVIRAAEQVGIQIPRFCDHPLLDPVGACRQCLVEIPDGGNGRPIPKPQASCTLTAAPGMVVRTQHTSPVADKAQQGNMEFLLINHPLDCPVCDKGGECPLQNQAMTNGRGESRFTETRRTFTKPINISPQVLLDRERCVLCARCTRFSDQIAGDPFIALVERGPLQQVGIYEREPFESYFSGNTVQICPVGALTSAAYRFRARPFDLISTPSVCEHCASGCALRTDHRRGKVTRRLAADDPAVNEEWNCDRGRFGFMYTRVGDRITRPLVRDEETSEMRPASWPEAFAVAARGLAAAGGAVGVLPGGRLTTEDAYSYAKFARGVLGTNDVDFRARPHSAEEAEFLAAHVATRPQVTYADLEHANAVALIGFEPEDESPIVFLRLRKAVRGHGTRIVAVASHTSRGLQKLSGRLVRARPGAEPAAVEALASDGELALDGGGVILVGERAAQTPGLLSAVASLAASTGARLAWVPRRAGERGALETGLLPRLLPGGRPVADAAARVDLGAAWGMTVAGTEGKDTDGIIAAAASGGLRALVVGGVEVDDLTDPAAALAALEAVDFLVSLEVRASRVTAVADVVLPVAPVAEKAGSFVNWEGRVRPFDKVLESSALTDTRVLAGISEALDRPLGFRSIEQARKEMVELGPWDGDRPRFTPVTPPAVVDIPEGSFVLSTWRTLIDDARGIDGEPYLLATGRRPIALVSPGTLARLGLVTGDSVTVSGEAGRASLPVGAADVPDEVVWLPGNSGGLNLRRTLGAGAGDLVSLQGGAA
ncbi:MAG: NADH-ubiquinone oxidoreductase chain G [uncultured Nocardioidaceae bacterium]|uniref:NADH-quinone oxidoreductase n=1 Tax=uncultured Nocardioidaceae bacterium TaxID=253824 RepID=A0A6J4MS28_9ACTN|nr:MAG: NADH-ubiquinone oxidoreductase chain G [uncultured Nocardioidaceae bacterium]